MPAKGYKMTPEQRARCSAAQTGRTLSESHKAKMRSSRLGVPANPAQRAALDKGRRNRKGIPFTPEHREALAKAHLGKPWSPARRARGNPVPGIETRAKMSAAMIGNAHVRDAPVKGECVYCFGPATTYDHVIPRGRPSWDDPDNVVLACMSCNGSKNDRTPEEWFAEAPRGRWR